MAAPSVPSAGTGATLTVAVLIPVLNRPERAKPLWESLRASARCVDLHAYFLISPGDDAELEAVRAALGPPAVFTPGSAWLVDWEPGPGDYARKINYGADLAVKRAGAKFVFLGADDLVFHPGWIERALATHMETGACVVGTNDLGNRTVMAGLHATHSLVHADYLDCGTIDEPDSGKLLHEGYDHNECDVEFVGTAIARQTWAMALDSIVEHAHPFWAKGEHDATYEKGQLHAEDDRLLRESRRRLWET